MDGIDKVLTALRESRMPLIAGVLWLLTAIVLLAGASAPDAASRAGIAIDRLNDWRELVPATSLALILGAATWVVGAISVDATRRLFDKYQDIGGWLRRAARSARRFFGKDTKQTKVANEDAKSISAISKTVCQDIAWRAASAKYPGVGPWGTVALRLRERKKTAELSDIARWLQGVEHVYPRTLLEDLERSEIVEHARGIAGLNASRRFYEAELRLSACLPAGFLVLALSWVFSGWIMLALFPLLVAISESRRSLNGERYRLLHAVESGMLETPTTTKLRSIGSKIGEEVRLLDAKQISVVEPPDKPIEIDLTSNGEVVVDTDSAESSNGVTIAQHGDG